MARKVFFSFHFDHDAWRVGQVRNSNVVTANYEQTRFLDGADWESIKRNGQTAIKNWIDSQLVGTSVTIVLIGAETDSREWVHYEIKRSWNEGKGLLGIYIHNIKNSNGYTDYKGKNPFDHYGFTITRPFEQSYYPRVYDWINDNGRLNIGNWIEKAAKDRGR